MAFRFDDLGSSAKPEAAAGGGTTFSDLGAKQTGGANQEYQDWGSWVLDLARTGGGQGVLLGFGDEIIGAARSLASGRPYAELRDEERDAVDRFRKQNPKTAFGAELAGGLLTPGLGTAAAVAKAPTLLGKAARAVPVGYGFGGVAGIGASESEDPREMLQAGHEAGKTGAMIAPALPIAGRVLGNALQKGDTAAQNLVNKEGSAQLYLADKLRSRGTTEAALADDLARGQRAADFHVGKSPDQVAEDALLRGRSDAETLKQIKAAQTKQANAQAPLPETIADVSPATQRTLRGIKVGGEADDIIEPFLGQRQAGSIDFAKGAEQGGQFSRLGDQLRLSLKLKDEDLADKLSALTGKRSAEADKLFDAARKGSEPFDLSRTLEKYNLLAMDMADPRQGNILRRAIALFDQSGTAGEKLKGRFPVDNIARFHNGKQALDDLLGSESIQQAGNLRRLLTGLKHDLMDGVFDGGRNQAYRTALDRYASKSELLNAAKLGEGFARGTEEVTDKMFRSLSEGERTMFRAAWLRTTQRDMGGKAAGPTTDFTQELRKPNTAQDLRMILPPTAGKSADFPGGNRERIGELVSREARMSDTSRKVLGNSSTAEKAADAIDIGRIARVTRYIKDTGGLVQAAAASLSDALEKMSAIKGDRARYLATKLLETDSAKQQAFLREVEKRYGANAVRQINDTFSNWLVRFEASFAGQSGRDAEVKGRQ
jgi:hypothetical protein